MSTPARKQKNASPRKKQSTSVRVKQEPVPDTELLPAPPVLAFSSSAHRINNKGADVSGSPPRRISSPGTVPTTPPKLSPKKRKAEATGNTPDADMTALSLQSPSSIRRSTRKPVLTEKAKFNVDEALSGLPLSPPGTETPNILRNVKRRVAEADAIDAACASDTASTISWSPSPAPQSKPRPRPKPVPRSQPLTAARNKGKAKVFVVTSDEDELDTRFIRPLTPYEDDLPTMEDVVADVHRRTPKPVQPQSLIDDMAAESDNEHENAAPDNGTEEQELDPIEEDGDEYDYDDSFIDDSGVGVDADGNSYEFVDAGDGDECGVSDAAEREEDADDDDADEDMEDEAGGDQDVTARIPARGQDVSEDLFLFDEDEGPPETSQASEDSSMHPEEEYLSDHPQISSRPGRSFRPAENLSRKKSKASNNSSEQKTLSFPAATSSPAAPLRPGRQPVVRKSTAVDREAPGTSTASETTDLEALFEASPTSTALPSARAKHNPPTLSPIPSKVEVAKGSSSVRTSRSHASPASTSNAASRRKEPPPRAHAAPTSAAVARPTPAPNVRDANSALDASLQADRLKFLYADLPQKARVQRGTVYCFKGDQQPPTALPYDGDYALGLCTDKAAMKRFVHALRFDSYDRIMHLNRNGNVPVRETSFDCMHFTYAGRSVPAVYVNTGFLWSSDLEGVRSPTKNIQVRQVCQEWELLQGSLGRILSAPVFHAQVDPQNGAVTFSTKKRADKEPKVGGRTDTGRGAGRTLPPVASGSGSSNSVLPSCAEKKSLRADEYIPVFDGRSSPVNGSAGFLFKPDDWKALESLPRYPDGEDLPEDAIVTVGFTVNPFGPFNTMVHKGVNLHALFVIVLDIPATSV
ncbi:hypothetical protein V5O48_007100 [Marasmius crinis-equi]|uniref:Uncharacterized protein n=1 Tax=Marasmius crinis-equi TaxID=585013 RepID=A0ABR3FIE2_9AGAR